MTDLEYSEVLKRLELGGTNNLLVGNGFSVAFDPGFNIKEVEITDDQSVASYDAMQRRIIDASCIGEMTGDDNSTEEGDRTTKFSVLNSQLIKKLMSAHVDSSDDIPQSEIENCRDFLSPFIGSGKVFSTNFDMLLNWVFQKDNCSYSPYRDGFDIKTRNKGERGWSGHANVFFCHGALNLYGVSPECFKISSDDHSLACIREKNNRGEKDCPLCVVERYSADKMKKIEQYKYLSSCLNELSNIKGNLVVFGFRGNDNDIHIIKAIGNAQKDNGLDVYWGLYDFMNQIERHELGSKFKRFGVKNVCFFDSRNVKVWR